MEFLPTNLPIPDSAKQNPGLLSTHPVYFSLRSLYIYITIIVLIQSSCLSDGDGSSGGNLGALITCLKLAKSLKLLKTNSLQHVASSGNMWNGIISEDAIRQALCHPVDQVRLIYTQTRSPFSTQSKSYSSHKPIIHPDISDQIRCLGVDLWTSEDNWTFTRGRLGSCEVFSSIQHV